MLVHNVTVRGRTSRIDGIDLVQGTAGEDFVSLDLDPEWDGLDVIVAFCGSGVRVAPAGAGDGLWPVPHEVIAETGFVSLTVEGSRDGSVLRTVDFPTAFRTLPSTSVYEAQSPTDPTLTEWREAYEKALSGRVESIEVETLPPGSLATASFGDHVLHLGIPQGEQGRSVRLYPGDEVTVGAVAGDVAINPETGDIFIWNDEEN